jgi:lipid II isoglutaminyl synthase (glutamine-hydrolysing)
MHRAPWFRSPLSGRAQKAMAIAVAACSSLASRAIGRSATAIPGLVAERIDPGILGKLGSRHRPVVLVIGTNGKTTTTRLIAVILERVTGRRPVSNRSGANLSQGIVTALLGARGGAAPAPAVFEVDELAFGHVAAALRPDVVVILNLVRDQLDRYGEVDAVERRWAEAIATLPRATTLVACADDPRLANIVSDASRQVRWFGLSADHRSAVLETRPRQDSTSGVAVSAPCPSCGGPTDVDDASTSRGSWRCTICGYRRPSPELAVRMEGNEDGSLRLGFELAPPPTSVDAGGAAGSGPDLGSIHVRLSGTAGAHDAAAAVLAGIALGLDPRAAVERLDGATPAFGRLEELRVGDRTVVLSLAKNPSSMAQAMEAVAMRRPDRVLVGLGDRAADGRDVSWIWDARLDGLLCIAPLTLTGSRADDLALRFKYADVAERPRSLPIVDGSIEHALADSLVRIRPGGILMVLATYTTLLRIRRVLERRGFAAAMPR